MNVVCVGYRNWALKIYNALSQTHNDKNFIVMNHTPSLDLLSTINPNPLYLNTEEVPQSKIKLLMVKLLAQ